MEGFSVIKRLPVNGKKCYVLPVNVKDEGKIPCLKHEGVNLEVVEEVMYLGNMFNSKGNNKCKIEDRVSKARTCMVESLALCSEITLGVYIVPSMLLTHNMMFIPTLLYGAQTWTNLTVEDSRRIKTLQLQYLKRMLRVPSSTSNSVILLELGVMPVLFEMDILKLMFLHHILTMTDDDPVKCTYNEQLRIPEEKNWANEVKSLRSKYEIMDDDAEIMTLSKDEWKTTVQDQVRAVVIETLNEEKNNLSKSSVYPDAETLKPAKYIYHFTVHHACILFRVRSRIVDVKELHQYKYGDNNICRCCGASQETLQHVFNVCPALASDACNVGDEFSEEISVLEKVVRRVEEFQKRVEESE